jgi:hypothetical protein
MKRVIIRILIGVENRNYISGFDAFIEIKDNDIREF